MTKKKGKTILLIFLVIAIICAIFLTISFSSSYLEYSMVSKSTDWTVYVKSNIINTLNSEYNPEIENMYCVNGIIDETNKKVTITTLTSIELAYANENQAASVELYPCVGQIGMIHTHPKYLGIPQCKFSELDFLTAGILYGENRLFLGGVYCDKDRVAFYLIGSDAIGNLILNNSRIGYELFD